MPRSTVKTSPITTSASHRASPCTLVGYQIGETAGSAAYVTIRDGGASGTVVAAVKLAAASSKEVWLGPEGIAMLTDLYVKVESGTVVGSAYIRD